MKINITSLAHKVIIVGILLTPLFTFKESVALIYGGVINNSTVLTSPYIKLIKDLVFISLILLSIFSIFLKSRITRVTLPFLFYSLLAILLAVVFTYTEPLFFALGIRWLLPVILLFLYVSVASEETLPKVAIAISFVFLVHLVMQLLQFFFAQGYFGINIIGFSLRNPGIFFIPSTSGFFSIVVLFFALFYLERGRVRSVILFMLPISILLTASGTAVAAYIFSIVFYSVKEKYYILLPAIVSLIALLTVNFIEPITGRSGLIEESFGVRINLFLRYFSDFTLLPEHFGYGTSTAYLLQNHLGLDFDLFATESLWAGLIVNTGLVNFYVSIFIVLAFIISTYIRRQKELLFFGFAYLMFSLTTGVLESYPMNLIFALVMGNYLKFHFKLGNSPGNYRHDY